MVIIYEDLEKTEKSDLLLYLKEKEIKEEDEENHL